MATFATSLLVMRWGILSAILMFCASSVKIKLRQKRHPVMALVCSGIGVGLSCWFVTGLLGITLSMDNVHNFMQISKQAFIEAMNEAPAEWPIP